MLSYSAFKTQVQEVSKRLGLATAPLTLTEKILFAHLYPSFIPKLKSIKRGETYLKLKPDRVAMQDASAQMAILQFMLSGRATTAVPTSIHCDHLIQASDGAESDLKRSLNSEREVYQFLQDASIKYGIEFWKPGAGIIHQIVLENYAAPGGLMLGTDSHTPNAGGLGIMAIGVGGADAVDAMADIPWELKAPKVLGVKLTGQLSGWASPKGQLSVRGGTGYVIEYFGEGVNTLSCTGMATICNMGAEVGATTSLFPFTASMARYLENTDRRNVSEACQMHQDYLTADVGAEQRYDDIIEIDLTSIEPHVAGPFSPDASIPISRLAETAKKNKWPLEIESSLIGSCTNSSYADMTRVKSLVDQAQDKGARVKTEFFLTPGSEQIRATMERDGLISAIEKSGAKVLANACGPCIGQWKRTNRSAYKENVILTSFNRNFRGRNDGNIKTMNFLASPEIVTALAFGGRLDFNPLKDSIKTANGEFKFSAPSGIDLPAKGFIKGREEFRPLQVYNDPTHEIHVDPASSRLQLLKAFPAWNGEEIKNSLVLIKVRGKCTTDHISAAGPWLKYKGHLENIAQNTLIGATNDENGLINVVPNQLVPGKTGSIPDVAKVYQKQGRTWAVIGDFNYGEGSAREHAALQPRFLGCSMIICKSFARIHETNLKKQGVLPLTFVNPEDYSKIPHVGAVLSTVGLVDLMNKKMGNLKLRVMPEQGSSFEIPVLHTLSEDQVEWLKHGSALNMIKTLQK